MGKEFPGFENRELTSRVWETRVDLWFCLSLESIERDWERWNLVTEHAVESVVIVGDRVGGGRARGRARGGEEKNERKSF